MENLYVILTVFFIYSIYGNCSEVKEFVDIPGFIDMENEIQKSIPPHLRLKRESDGQSFNKMPRTKIKTSMKWIEGIIEEHNRLRDIHAVEPLTLDEELCKTSQFWSEYLAQVSEGRSLPVLFRRKWFEVGGNMWASVGRKDATPLSAPFSWYNEERFYTYGNNTYCGKEEMSLRFGVNEMTSHHADHFTQLIWKGSKTVGCAKTKNRIGHIYIVCHYQPPGNVRGKYKENVPYPVKFL